MHRVDMGGPFMTSAAEGRMGREGFLPLPEAGARASASKKRATRSPPVSPMVVYTGTHDNPTTRGWYERLPATQRQHVWAYIGRTGGGASEVLPALIYLAWGSMAALAIARFSTCSTWATRPG